MRRTAPLLIAVVLALGVAACGDDADDVSTDPAGDDPGATEPAGLNDPLLDRDLIATAVIGGHQVVDRTTITLAFDGSNVSVDAGCNHLSGTYSYADADADSAVLVVEALGGTEMACDPERMEQDAWISGFLTDRPLVTTEDDGATVILTAGAEIVTLTDEEPAADALPLVGTTWTLDTITFGTDADGTAATPPAGVTATITFADDGTYAVAAGCNTGSGTYAEAGAGIYQIDPPALTRRRCENAAMEVEQAVLETLEGEVSISVDADRLTIEAEGSGLGFTGSG